MRVSAAAHTTFTRTCPLWPGNSLWGVSAVDRVGFWVGMMGFCSLSLMTAMPRALNDCSPSVPVTCRVKNSPFSRVVSLSNDTETVFSCSPGANVKSPAWAM
jgi:hypothetical protein